MCNISEVIEQMAITIKIGCYINYHLCATPQSATSSNIFRLLLTKNNQFNKKFQEDVVS